MKLYVWEDMTSYLGSMVEVKKLILRGGVSVFKVISKKPTHTTFIRNEITDFESILPTYPCRLQLQLQKK